MFIPLRTDRQTRRRPIVTEILLVLNLAVYLAGLAGEYFGVLADRGELAHQLWLNPLHFEAWQLITYQFLHDPHGFAHIVFNMLFLWVFGAAVEDRLGRLWFVAFYLAGGAVAGLAHMWTSDAPVIGASGSVAAVSGAFLALFPRMRIQVLVFFFLIGVYALPATLFIGLYFAIDMLRATGAIFGGQSDVAFMAHIGGYIYGFTVAFTLLGTGVLKRTEFDAFYLFRQARRRAEFRRAQKQSEGAVWDASASNTRTDKPARLQAERKMKPADEQLLRKRSAIHSMLDEHRTDEAVSVYVEFQQEFPNGVLSQRHQTDIANALYASGNYGEAAQAYERLLAHHKRADTSGEIRLLLAMILARQLGQLDRAKELLKEAQPRLSSDSQRDLADQLLTELNT